MDQVETSSFSSDEATNERRRSRKNHDQDIYKGLKIKVAVVIIMARKIYHEDNKKLKLRRANHDMVRSSRESVGLLGLRSLIRWWI